MEYRHNSRPERTVPFMTGTNIHSADMGPDEDRRNSPVRPLTDHFVMKRAINHWTPPKHPSYNLIAKEKNWPKRTPSPESLSEAGFLLFQRYVHFYKFYSLISFQIFVSLVPKFCHYR